LGTGSPLPSTPPTTSDTGCPRPKLFFPASNAYPPRVPALNPFYTTALPTAPSSPYSRMGPASSLQTPARSEAWTASGTESSDGQQTTSCLCPLPYCPARPASLRSSHTAGTGDVWPSSGWPAPLHMPILPLLGSRSPSLPSPRCYNPLFSGWYLQQVTDSPLTITSLCPIAVAIAKSVDSYLATSIARLL